MKSEVWRRRLKRTLPALLGGAIGIFVLAPLLPWGRHPYSYYLIIGGVAMLTITVCGLVIPFIYDICYRKGKCAEG